MILVHTFGMRGCSIYYAGQWARREHLVKRENVTAQLKIVAINKFIIIELFELGIYKNGVRHVHI